MGLASLTLLSAAATARPLLCVVDDAQWLDQESAAVLAFVARRLNADAIGMLFAVREPSERRISLDGLPSLHVPGLPPAEARQLLTHAAGDKLSSEVIEQLITQTSGNPLALIELGRDLAPEQLRGEAFLPSPLPVGRTLQARFLGQVRRLPAATQILLLTAAADPTGDPALLWRASTSVSMPALPAAEAAELVTIGTALAFRHPLVRSAIYHGATLPDRQRVHQALAEATDPASGVDLSAWHRSVAATGPDEAIAKGLEQAAERARRRGGWAATGAYLTRAAAFTPDAADRLRRVLAAAQAESIAGAALRAQVLLDSVAGELRDPHQRIAAQRIQGAIHYALMQPAKTASILLEAARQIAPVDVGQARHALLDALAASLLSGRLAAVGATRVDIARAVRSIPQSPLTGSIGDLLLDADTALLLDSRQAAAPALSRAVAALQETPLESADLLTWTDGWAAGALNDDGALYSLANRLENQARDQAAVPTLSVALTLTGTSELFAGDLGRARAAFTEREAIEGASGEECGVGEAMVLAWQGQVSDARARVAAAARSATKCGLGWKLVYLEYALAVLELGQGHYEEALAAAPHGYDESVILSCFALPDLIEAAARCGELAFARDALHRVEDRAAASPTPLALGLLARSRALLAAGPMPRRYTRRRSRSSARQGGRVTSPALTSCTGSGCGGRSDGGTHGSTCGPPGACSTPWGLAASLSEPGLNSPRPERLPASAIPASTTTSPLRNFRSRCSPRQLSPTQRSRRSSSSAPKRSTTTSARSSGSSA